MCIYDSVWPHGVSDALCSFYKCQRDTLDFEVMDVKRQQNMYDIGVLAAIHIAHGQGPTLNQWDTSKKMRKHLELCLENGQMQRFPTTETRQCPKMNVISKIIKEPIFWKCRLPNGRTRDMIKYVH